MKNESIGTRLKRFREAAGLNPYRLGQISGIDPGYIARIESGAIKSTGIPTLQKLARSLHVSLTQLIGEEDQAQPDQRPEKEVDKFVELKRVLGKFGVREFEFIGEAMQVPVRGYVRAGTPSVNEQQESENVIISRNLIKPLTNRTGGVYALQVSGESLAGDGIHTGDHILVLQTRAFDIDGKLYIIRDPRTGESVVRHLRHKNGRIRIEASNADYQPLLLEEVEVMGRVIYVQPQGKAV